MRVRVKFTKNGSMKYIGHLDVMRYFQKVLRRAEIDVAFSGGFSPHMIMSFAAPLGVGTTSSGEYFDLDLKSATTSKDMEDRMNAQMGRGMSVVSVRQISEDKASKGMTLVAAADYRCYFELEEVDEDALMTAADSGHAEDQENTEDAEEKQPRTITCGEAVSSLHNTTDIHTKIRAFLAQDEINVWRKTKRSEGLVNIRPWIYSFSFENNVDTCCSTTKNTADATQGTFRMKISQGSVSNLKPDLVIKAFADYAGFVIPEGSLRIHREEIYANIGTETRKQFVSLESLGEMIV